MPAIARLLDRIDRLPPAWLGGALMLIAALFRGWIVWHGWHDSFEHLVAGVPVSDGRGWDSMAREFALGERNDPSWAAWAARRPLYWIVMGGVFSLFGPSLEVTRAFHLALGVVSVGLIFEIVRRMTSVWIASLVALGQALLPIDAQFCLQTTTEPLGAFLTNAALLAATLGAEAQARQQKPTRALLLAGALLGLANLARPQNLPVIALWAVLLLALPPAKLSHDWRASLALLVGCAITLAPWLLRQHHQFGFWALSDNSAESAYAVTSPALGEWRGLGPEVAGMSIAERYRFLMAAASDNFRADPAFFFSNLLEHSFRFGQALRPLRAVIISIAALHLLRRREAWVARTGIALASLLSPTFAALNWLGGALLALGRRTPQALIALLLLGTTITTGAGGVGVEPRFSYPYLWMATALAASLLSELSDRAAAGAWPAHPWTAPRVPSWGLARRPIQWGAVAASVLLMIGIGKATLARPTAPAEAAPLDATAWIARVLAPEEAAPYRSLADRLVVRRARIRPDYLMRFEAGQAVDHFSPLFNQARPYAFAAFETLPILPELRAVFPGPCAPLEELERSGEEVILIGLPVQRPLEGGALELIAIGREAGVGSIVRPAPELVPAHAQHLLSMPLTSG